MDARTRQLVEQPCRVTMAGYVNPMEDAAAERRKSTFNPDELAAFLHGGEDKLARRWGAGRLGEGEAGQAGNHVSTQGATCFAWAPVLTGMGQQHSCSSLSAAPALQGRAHQAAVVAAVGRQDAPLLPHP